MTRFCLSRDYSKLFESLPVTSSTHPLPILFLEVINSLCELGISVFYLVGLYDFDLNFIFSLWSRESQLLKILNPKICFVQNYIEK